MLPNGLHDMESLQHLTISNCKLGCIPKGGLLTKLKSICIEGCPELSNSSKYYLKELISVRNFIFSDELTAINLQTTDYGLVEVMFVKVVGSVLFAAVAFGPMAFVGVSVGGVCV
ncbi:hypothetical protein Patl1_17097 [Pistacia atlantica]|uniref:Uncharacterized protein n=1 Tax=Pistacia atlantica TaxID=434234 RepID=A0ACC1B7A3_9ROSI|nr:hypothetical protein Patl1_17097 [Pistacia atlantica]